MSDMGETWRAFKDESRKRKQEKKEELVPLLEKACQESGISLEKITEYQWRMGYNNKRLDIYPSTMKYLVVGIGKSQRFSTIVQLIDKIKSK